MIGQRLRQYLVTASLGRGGMGEVWLARDTTLDRDVAIKTLPAGDADAATRKERFFREARAASALNHPNIITIYEINSDEGIDFIAMEYVDGRTLDAVMHHGPLAFDLVRRVACQIAEAVGRAHRAGIVHRDLKPGNIMITNDGLVKVLDFGLAKITHAADADSAANAATQAALTQAGTTVGTLGYMSPEQAIGDAVDARSDVFSFGVILYEMLTGRRPFSGTTLSEVLRQLHFAEPPSLESLRAEVPAALRRIVMKALRKNPEDRFPNMGEVANALNGGSRTDARSTVIAAPAPAVRPRPEWRLARLALAGLLVVLTAGIAGKAVRRSRPPAAPMPVATNAPAALQPAAVPAPEPPAPTPPAAPTAASPTLEPAAASDPARDVEVDRRAIGRVEPQVAATTGDADFESRRALDLAKLGDRAAALAALDNVAARQNLSAQALFRMAIVYELGGARQRALMLLARAVRTGYPVQDVAREPELAALRTDPRYHRLVAAAPVRTRPARRIPPR